MPFPPAISILLCLLDRSRPAASQGGKIVGSGNVVLGVRTCAALNEQFSASQCRAWPGWGSDPASIGTVGIRNKISYTAFGSQTFYAGKVAGIERPGNFFEGWTVGSYDSSSLSYPEWCGDNGNEGAPNGWTGFRNFNLQTCRINRKRGEYAKSQVKCRMKGAKRNFLKVTHKYLPVAGQPDLYQVEVKIRNLKSETTAISDLRYRRSFDWNVDPYALHEYVTHHGTSSCSDVVKSIAYGQCHPDPNPDNGCSFGVSGDFTDTGPADLGSTLEFKLGPLQGKKTKTVRFYYGLSHPDGGSKTSEQKMKDALAAVGANVYSLGQAHYNHNTGYPYTFGFGYSCSRPQEEGDGDNAPLRNDYSWVNRNKNINCMTDPKVLCTGDNRIEGLLMCPRSCSAYCRDVSPECSTKMCDEWRLKFDCFKTCGLCYAAGNGDQCAVSTE